MDEFLRLIMSRAARERATGYRDPRAGVPYFMRDAPTYTPDQAQGAAVASAGTLPVVGDAMDAFDVWRGLVTGDKSRAAWGAAGLALPFVAAGSLKRLGGAKRAVPPPHSVRLADEKGPYELSLQEIDEMVDATADETGALTLQDRPMAVQLVVAKMRRGYSFNAALNDVVRELDTEKVADEVADYFGGRAEWGPWEPPISPMQRLLGARETSPEAVAEAIRNRPARPR